MKVFSKHIFCFGFLIASALLTACSDKEFAEPDSSQKAERMPRISINITPVALNAINSDVVEMIGSLRVMILSEVTDTATGEKTCYVEYNEFFDFTGNDEDGDGMFSGLGDVASTFKFIITRNTVPGLKKFYLIANECQVKGIKFQDKEDMLPEGIREGMDLHDFLSYYTADLIPNLDYPEVGSKPEEGQPKGAEFDSLVNSIYYTPDFLESQQTLSEDGMRNVIFLPYTSLYTFEMAKQADIDAGISQGAVNVLDKDLYLVPCATKFQFQFQNYRPNEVKINSFKLGGIASDMYLFAQVYGNDLYKDYGAQKGLWWVDWLSYVSLASDQYKDPDDNLAFSNAYGWMNLYKIPTDAYDYDTEGDIMDLGTRYGVIDLTSIPGLSAQTEQPWVIPANVGNPITGNPGILTTNYIYLPESRYMVEFPMYDDKGEWVKNEWLQAYYLKLDMTSGELSAVKDTQIGNLGALFRNTKTYITIKLRDALDVGAYAQLEPWEESHTNGTVLEEKSE